VKEAGLAAWWKRTKKGVILQCGIDLINDIAKSVFVEELK